MSLQRYIFKRVAATIPVVLAASMLTFALVALTPGDPVDYIIAFQDVSPEVERQLREQYGLDKPIYLQYLDWLIGVIQFDFGRSISAQRPVADMIAARLPYTLLMGGMALVVAVVTSVPLGIAAAYYRGSVIDQLSRVFSVVGIAIPNFFLGLLLLLIFASRLGIFPYLPPADAPVLSLEMILYTLLPAVTIGTASTALLMRLMRSSMVEELDKDYVTMARAKGLPERTVITKHVLRNSLSSVVTVTAIQVAFIISGSVVVEIVFSYPGIGRLLVNSVGARDFPVIQAIVLLISISVILSNLLADIVYAYLDPRITY